MLVCQAEHVGMVLIQMLQPQILTNNSVKSLCAREGGPMQ
jgi:hypothetical protein